MGLDLPLFGAEAPPTVRRPVFEVGLSAGAGGGGGLFGAVAGAVGLAGGGGASDPWQRTVASITVELGLAPAADGAEIVLATGSAPPAVAVGDAGPLSLGYEDAGATVVLTGEVREVRRGIRGALRVGLGNGGAALAALRLSRSFESQSAGQIVRQLAGEAGVTTGTVQDGADLPFYVADDRRSAWAHVAALARASGFLAYFTAAGELFFAPYQAGQAVRTYTYGDDLLAVELSESPAPLGAVTVYGEGAAGGQGKDAWAWLVKDPSSVTGASGSGGPERAFADRSLRSTAAAAGAAAGIAFAAGLGAVSGRALVPGSPEVVPGATIAIAGAPDDALNGSYLVRGVGHALSKPGGFTSRIAFSRVAAGGGGGGLAGGLGGLL